MRNFISYIKDFSFYKKEDLSNAVKSFSNKEFTFFISCILIASVSIIFLLSRINNSFMVEVPDEGGSITEGIVGSPTLVNPVLALSDADKDITSLVYSGLMRKTGEGLFIPDLAESYTVSPNGTVYTFVLREDAEFHNGEEVTADDVVFTIGKVKDPQLKSPKKASWDGVEVSKLDNKTVQFILVKPYISFMNNTTLGILPAKLWRDLSPTEFSVSPLNVKAIGSGPYKIESVSKNSDSIPEEYKLKKFKDFVIGNPHIKNLNIISFPNEKDLLKALTSGAIDQASGISPENAKTVLDSGLTINTVTLPRMFGIFFNENKNKILADASILKAIDLGIDRQNVIDQVLYGYGESIHSPIPSSFLQEEINPRANIDAANTILEKAGWTIREDGIRAKGGEVVKKQTTPITRLSFSITTGDTPELRQAATVIKNQLEQIGIEVDIKKIYETGQLNQLIRARDYEALFFGQILNNESDLFSYWHSSQINDPGLNIAMYNNKKVDGILDLIQKTGERDDRAIKYESLNKEFNADIPAILIYSPKYLYATSKKLNHIDLDMISVQSDRFSSVYTWYANTNKVWKIFTKEE